ncbi:MAG: hypothetical protein DWQ10_05955 [Calditrichaeota bacterium]|nr:MAG: hypothetical protein DWQ10_05955 [Calditrichota bacterium]
MHRLGILLKIGSFATVLALAVHLLLLSFSGNRNTEFKWPSKTDFSRMRRHVRQMHYVYSDASSQSQKMQDALQQLSRKSRFVTIKTEKYENIANLSQNSSLCFVGTPSNHAGISEFLLNSNLNLSIENNAINFNGMRYDDDNLILLCSQPNPAFPNRYFRLITAPSENVLLETLLEKGNFPRLIGDFSIYSGEQLLVYGFFEQPSEEKPWILSKFSEISSASRIDIKNKSEIFTVEYHGREPANSLINKFVQSREKMVRAMLKRLEIDSGSQNNLFPIQLDIYETTEQKFLATQKTGFADWDSDRNSVALVLNERFPKHNFSAIAQCILEKSWGLIENNQARQAAGMLFSDSWGGKGYSYWAGLFFHGGLFVSLEETLYKHSQSSEFIRFVELATWLEFLWQKYDIETIREFLAKIPSTYNKNSLNLFPEQLKQAWLTWCNLHFQIEKPDQIGPTTNFLTGFCYAHEGYQVYNGYLGTNSNAAIRKLATLNVNAISLTPFAYFGRQRYLQQSQGLRQENDESLIIASQYARNAGMKIMLKPHIWVSWESWPGAIDFQTEKEVNRFFDAYEAIIIHYAILAQMQKYESLCIGVELVKMTTKYEKKWRRIIENVRKVYAGQLIYAANWGKEFENIAFWDALDAIGLNFYYPLSPGATFDDDDVLKHLTATMQTVKRIKNKFNRPVYLTEIGFASRPKSWQDPHKDGHKQDVDLGAQASCYKTVFPFLLNSKIFTGIFIWKWPSSLDVGGTMHSGFTPNGKPSEDIIKEIYGQYMQ